MPCLRREIRSAAKPHVRVPTKHQAVKMHDGNLMVHGKNEEYTAKPPSRAALVSFILRMSLEPPRAALIEPSSSTIEARTALATAPLFLTLGLGLVKTGKQNRGEISAFWADRR